MPAARRPQLAAAALHASAVDPLPANIDDAYCAAFRDAVVFPRNALWMRPWMRNKSLDAWRARQPEQLPRVYDLFIFGGELDLLEARLHVLDGVVDRFVFIEADRTFSGLNRTMVFERHWSRFERFRDRIVYRAWRAADASAKDALTCDRQRNRDFNSWQCQRLLRGRLSIELLAAGARPEDVVVSSDVDEIPKAGYVDLFRRCTIIDIERENVARSHPNPFILTASTYFYNTGCQPQYYRWFYGPKIGARFHFDGLSNVSIANSPRPKRSNTNYRRWSNTVYSAPQFDHSAWHLSNFFSVERMILKMRSFSAYYEFEGKRSALLERARVEQVLQNCSDVFATGGKYGRMRRVRATVAPNASSRNLLAFVNHHFPHMRPAPSSARVGAARARTTPRAHRRGRPRESAPTRALAADALVRMGSTSRMGTVPQI